MEIKDYYAIPGAILGAFATSCSLWFAWKQHKRAVKAEAAQKRAEELRLKSEEASRSSKRRANAPYLTPSNTTFQNLFTDQEEGCVGFLGPRDSKLLCFCRDEVEKVKAGDYVVMVVNNAGKAARRVAIKLDGQPVEWRQEPDIDGSHGLQFLAYLYDPARHGTAQTLTISFETEDGNRDTHTYMTKHGFRILKRVDPC